MLTIDEFCDDRGISAALARCMARYHSLELPVPKTRKGGHKLMRKNYAKHLENLKKVDLLKIPNVSEQFSKAVNTLYNFDMASEADWIEKVGNQIKQRIVFCHGDANRGNTLLSLEETGLNGHPLTWDERILLIDYEFSSYDPRGADIGNHFGMQVHDFGQQVCLMQKEYPSEERRRAFVEAYVGECKKLDAFNDWDEDGADSVENIMLECDFGVLYTRIGMLSFAQIGIANFAQMAQAQSNADPEFIKQVLLSKNLIKLFLISWIKGWICKFYILVPGSKR